MKGISSMTTKESSRISAGSEAKTATSPNWSRTKEHQEGSFQVKKHTHKKPPKQKNLDNFPKWSDLKENCAVKGCGKM